MNREAFEARVQELLDRRQPPSRDPELLRAAETEPQLARLLQAFELLGAFRRPCPDPSADLAERVAIEFRNTPVVAQSSLPPWLTPFVAVAATLLIATTISLLSDRGKDAARNAAAPDDGAVAESNQSGRPPSKGELRRLGRRAAENYRELAATTGQSLSSALSVMQPAPRATGVESKPVRTQDDWLRRVPDGLRPLSSSTSGAVYSLMRVVPGTEDSDQDEF